MLATWVCSVYEKLISLYTYNKDIYIIFISIVFKRYIWGLSMQYDLLKSLILFSMEKTNENQVNIRDTATVTIGFLSVF